jgi:hypothetical protein
LRIETENDKLFYEIESKDGNTTRDLLYNPNGTLAESEEVVALTDLPAEAQQLIHSKYPKAVVSKAEKTTAATKLNMRSALGAEDSGSLCYLILMANY